MDAINDISSTCENDLLQYKKSSAVQNLGKSYDCESDSEYDSENETIDVICENSGEREFDERNITKSNPFQIFNREFLEAKNFHCSKNYSGASPHSSSKDTLNSVINSRSKTFLIDSILGNNKNCDSNISNPTNTNEESDNFEETADEHNGKNNNFFIQLHLF